MCQDLFHVLREKGPLAEMEARRYFRQILEANINFPQNGVLHRNLKPGNMLLDAKRGEIDFGLASEVHSMNLVTPSEVRLVIREIRQGG